MKNYPDRTKNILRLGISGAGIVILLAIAAGSLWPKQKRQISECVAFASCRPSYDNSGVCESLPIGTSRDQLYAKLGQPIQISGSTLLFDPSATESYSITVALDSQGNTKDFYCRGKR